MNNNPNKKSNVQKMHIAHSDKPKLQKHAGCKNCTKICRFNAPITIPNQNNKVNSYRFGCNNSKEVK